MSWKEPPRKTDGKLSTQTMFFDVSTNIIVRDSTPKWLYWFGFKRLNEIDEAYTTFEAFMRERVSDREAELKVLESRSEDNTELIKDIFGRLVNARLSDGKLKLSDQEIIANCFIFVSFTILLPCQTEIAITFQDVCWTW